MNPIIINEEKCIGCGLCAKDCPSSYVYVEGGKAHTNKGGCIECGHCYAICPQGAVMMAGYECKEEAVVPMTELPPVRIAGGLFPVENRRAVEN